MNDLLVPAEVERDPQALGVVMEADELSEAMTLIAVDSQEELDFAAGELTAIVQRKDMIEATFKRLKKPFDDGIAGLRDFFDEPLKRLRAAEAFVKQQIAGYTAREQARRQELMREHATSREDRVLELKDKAAELEVASITSDDPEKAEAYAEQAAEVRSQIDQMESLPAPADIPLAPKAAGVSVRAKWVAEVTDRDKLWAEAQKDQTIRELFVIDQGALDRLATIVKSSRTIPGVRIWNKGSVAARRNRRSPESPQP